MGQRNSLHHLSNIEELRRALDMLDFFAGMAEVEDLRRGRRCGSDAALPILILGGFLGAGKSTLLRHLLTAEHGKKITALVNDVAAINIDARLIADASDDTVALANGCVCCSQSGELAMSLAKLADREDRPDLAIVETSGVADVWALAQIVERVDGCWLDGIVTVVDPTMPPSETTSVLYARQLSAADVVLLNKLDLASPEQLSAARARIRDLAPKASVLETTECAVPPLALLGPLQTGLQKNPAETGWSQDAEDLISSLCLTSDTSISRAGLEAAIATLPCPLLRAKGFMRFKEDPANVVTFQQTGTFGRFHSGGPDLIGAQLVLIGHKEKFDTAALAQHFMAVGLRPAGHHDHDHDHDNLNTG